MATGRQSIKKEYISERKSIVGYIGEVGKRIKVKATYKKSFEYTDYKFSYYGTTHFIHTFEDADGNVIVWKSTNTVFEINDGKENPARKGDTEPIAKGSVVELTGSVKEHGTYKEMEQTVVTRCKFKVIERAKTAAEIQHVNNLHLTKDCSYNEQYDYSSS